MPQHPPAQQLRAARDARRGARRRAAVRPQGQRHDEAVAGQPGGLRPGGRTRSRTSPSTCSTTWSPPRRRRTARSRPRRPAPGPSCATPVTPRRPPLDRGRGARPARGRPLVVLTGAGLSHRLRHPRLPRAGRAGADADDLPGVRRPGPTAQQRYWARSHLGWRGCGGAEPNAGHRALARARPRTLLITQNVDGLHERGRVAAPGRPARPDRRRRLPRLPAATAARRAAAAARRALNPGWLERHAGVAARPDGDVDLDDTAGFVVPALRGVRRRAQARRGVLRRERPGRPGRSAATPPSTRSARRRAARRRVVADGDERPAVRAPGGQGRDAGGDRQPRARPAATSWRRTRSRRAAASSCTGWLARRVAAAGPQSRRDEDVLGGLEDDLGGLAAGADAGRPPRWRRRRSRSCRAARRRGAARPSAPRPSASPRRSGARAPGRSRGPAALATAARRRP